ncbi:uncharacterized protein N7483_004021 [Penicillium malachiteum]|uniref:uncharacterized protein n=1 Tax=Penicillium malachiteum TaxID=1324776 RepID=UPI002547884F|nr:uncharacterized protein N7483_004021 [Penicillium malachiteum]KAJ5729513.1 hypothetical protein N7483_004021 [Penicillium malachiteum]
MPRRKAADRTGPVKTRSRSGCQECRASRVRCDTKKPICTRCWEKGLTCTTNLVLKWESEFVSRGAAFGRAGVWNKAKSDGSTSGAASPYSTGLSPNELRQWCLLPQIQQWAFINSGVGTYENPSDVDVISNEQSEVSLVFRNVTNNPALMTTFRFNPMPALSLFPQASQVGHGELLDYYLQQVCPRTSASSTMSSPFASVILPFSVSASPTLFKAIQALGACHRARADPSYAPVSLRLKSETLRDLRRRLSHEGSSMCSADPEVLVIMMMLCLYEITDKCDQQWTIHLKGAKDLIRLRRQRALAFPEESSLLEPASAFAEHFFAFQDVMGRTACAKEVLFGSDYWKADDRSIDLWMGCSPELVSILSTITDMSRARRHLDSDSVRDTFYLEAKSIEHQLEHLVQEVGDDGDEDDALASAAEAKRLAALLYLHCGLYGASPTTPLVVEYVHQILRLLSEQLDRGSLASVTWPLFVAAVELDPSHDELWSSPDGTVSGRSIILRALSAMAESTISNIARTRAVIVQVWQARDQDLLKAPQIKGLNDWEWYVVPVSDAMSLA